MLERSSKVKIGNLANNTNEVKKPHDKVENEEKKSKLTFGDDDLDVPTFLRSRKF